MIGDNEYCFKCGKPYVYSYHKGDEWYIRCVSCGKRTKVFNTHKEAIAEWERLKRYENDKANEWNVRTF